MSYSIHTGGGVPTKFKTTRGFRRDKISAPVDRLTKKMTVNNFNFFLYAVTDENHRVVYKFGTKGI